MANEFNKKQLEAINTPPKQNVLISAGAGSGKTKTLTEKVYKLINEKHIATSSLLVLTFTDKASFEMKERIVAKFSESNSEFKNQIFSAHIQTFDSFMMYLVNKYSTELNLSSNVKILSKELEETKIVEILENILDTLYEENSEILQSAINKFCFKSDDMLYSIIRSMYSQIKKVSPSLQNDLLHNYEKMFLNRKKIYILLSDSVNDKINKLKSYLDILVEEFTYEDYDEKFALTKIKEVYFNELENYNTTNDFSKILDLLETYKARRKHECLGQNNKKLSALNSEVKKVIEELSGYGNIDEQVDFIMSFKQEALFFINIINELDKQLFDYKTSINSFTYGDIAHFAYKLLSEKKYAKVHYNITNRFKYVLIDEYQDTSDLQELFIKTFQEKSTLFFVGDIKQSIYRFRDANCDIFNSKRMQYLNDDNSTVIDMQQNYRSVSMLLSDVNAFFINIMTKKNMDIDYKKNEQLLYDEEVDLFKVSKSIENSEYGITVLDYDRLDFNTTIEQEISIIIEDIKDKIKNKYQVLKNPKEFRDCTYKDFAILVKRSKNVYRYKKMFFEHGIPLNFNVEEQINDINVVIVLQSLLKLMVAIDNDQQNYKDLFMSVARSFLFRINDDEIHTLISSGEYVNHYIIEQIKLFVKDSKNQPFIIMFDRLINSFDVINKLNLIGEINNNIDKIETIRNKVSEYSSTGEGIEGFVNLFINLAKYKIDYKIKSEGNEDDAVELITIHGSKGLEYKIVYMCSSDNEYSYIKSGIEKVKFSKKFGFVYERNELGKRANTLIHKIIDNKDSEDSFNEYIRLIYVAFTRAKESLYLVGHGKSKNSINPGFVDKAFRRVIQLNENNVEKILEEKVLPLDVINDIRAHVNEYNTTDGDNDARMKIFLSNIKLSIEQLVFGLYGNINRRNSNFLCKATNLKLVKKFNGSVASHTEDKIKDTLKKVGSSIAKINRFVSTCFGCGDLFSFSFEGIRYKYVLNDVKHVDDNKRKLNLFSVAIDDSLIDVQEKQSRASMIMTVVDDELTAKLEFGNRIHFLLEHTDLKTKDTSFIVDLQEKAIVDKVLSMDIFNDINDATILKEYAYMDNNTKGYIDLLIVKEHEVYIVDYKSSDISKVEYEQQLYAYKNYIEQVFLNKKIRMILISNLTGKYKEVI